LEKFEEEQKELEAQRSVNPILGREHED